MNQTVRLLLVIAPLGVGIAVNALPGRAQAPSGGRFAFADTTLLRDTLDLHFDGLFQLADSLEITPDTLRALSIRYRFTLPRLVSLAESLSVPVDSVGPILERERYNPLSAAFERTTTLRYNSTYNIAQTATTWTNGGDYSMVLGSIFLRNTTSIVMDRYLAGGRTSLRQTRSAVTEGGWKFSPNLSAGARADLSRFDTATPGAVGNEGETRNEFQLSVRTRQQPSSSLSSDFNLRGGVLSLKNVSQDKNGVSGDMSGHVRFARGTWLTHDLNGTLSGNIARSRPPNLAERLRTHDYRNTLRGTLGLLANSPVSGNVTYSLSSLLVETPTDSGTVSHVVNDQGGADFSLRLRQDSERYLNVTERIASSSQASASLLNSRSSGNENGLNASWRYVLLAASFEGSFSNGHKVSEFPTRGTDGGYGERSHARSIEATVSRSFGTKFNLRAKGSVNLTSYRYYVIGKYLNSPVDRDQYQQSYRLEGNYTRSDQLSSSLALEVKRTLNLNLSSSSATSNNEVHSYDATWSWTFRLLPGLTANQVNLLSADYTYYHFTPQSDRLLLSYTNNTTLNAVVSPHLTVDVSHILRSQPSGDYQVDPELGLYTFSPADETSSASLSVRIAYTPTPALTLSFQPDYQANDRYGTVNGAKSPQRTSRTLNFSGGASLNVPLGRRARLTGDIRRTYRADRTTQWSNGVPSPAPRSELDYWNGQLQLSWTM